MHFAARKALEHGLLRPQSSNLRSGVGQLFVYSQLFVYFSQISHLEASNTKTAQSKDVWIECLESNYISCGRSLREFPLLLVDHVSCDTDQNALSQHSIESGMTSLGLNYSRRYSTKDFF